MDFADLLNSGSASTAAAGPPMDQRLQQQLRPQSNCYSNSPQSSEYSSRYSEPRVGQVNGPNGLNTGLKYPSPAPGYHLNSSFDVITQQNLPTAPADVETRKAFDCSSCGKDFAKRGDLHRHERIHNGVRPYVCDYPGCSKKFVQRTQLILHTRVHTGEKPYVCERCGKPFSDPSSFARHKRIHSGKRPYECPYTGCHKTYTRRTGLNRHQNDHRTSTIVEEAAAATAAALAARTGSNQGGRQVSEDGAQYLTNGSPMSTISPSGQNPSLSPNAEQLASMNGMHRHLDLRGDHLPDQDQPHPTTASYFNSLQRPTSHVYGTFEPPEDSPLSDSITGSPHMGHTGRHLPLHIPSPASQSNGYIYPDPEFCGN